MREKVIGGVFGLPPQHPANLTRPASDWLCARNQSNQGRQSVFDENTEQIARCIDSKPKTRRNI